MAAATTGGELRREFGIPVPIRNLRRYQDQRNPSGRLYFAAYSHRIVDHAGRYRRARKPELILFLSVAIKIAATDITSKDFGEILFLDPLVDVGVAAVIPARVGFPVL